MATTRELLRLTALAVSKAVGLENHTYVTHGEWDLAIEGALWKARHESIEIPSDVMRQIEACRPDLLVAA